MAKPLLQQAPAKLPGQKEMKEAAAAKQVAQALPQVRDDKYGGDELKALDGFDKAFSGHEGADEPLDRAKLEAEIKPAVKESVKDVKPAAKSSVKTVATA